MDHPRSRGVYNIETPVNGCGTGSSPLARGLQRASDLVVPSRGIIPARAGFTHPARAVAGLGRDHPRSRGVYHAAVEGIGVLQGSSPLARGLLQVAKSAEIQGRIIPARAGFTTTAQCRW